MIYTNDTKKAMILCYEAHKGQTDKSGLPYVYHPFHLAEQMDDEDSTIVALLHDVAEDTEYDIDYIRGQGYSDNVVEALELMTHEKSVPYMDYVRKIKENPLATKVKLADLAHNSDTTRLNGEPTDEDRLRVKKYAEAIRILNGESAGGLAGIVYGLDSEFAKDCLKKLKGKERILECL